MLHTLGVQEAFGIVIFIVVGVGSLVALVTFATSGRSYDEIGKGGLFDEGPAARTPATGAAADRERDDEIRQMLEARNARRVRRGEATVDVDVELAALTRTRIDPALLQEIRELVEARNRRRVRAGKEPLDVEAEIARQAQELGDL
jgi:hypothetical protein